MKLQEVKEPLAARAEGVTNIIRAFLVGNINVAEVQGWQELYDNGNGFCATARAIISRNRMPVAVLKRGDRVYLAKK